MDTENLIAAKTFNEHQSAAVKTNLNITRTCPRCSRDVPTMLLMIKEYHKDYMHHLYVDCNWVVDAVCICLVVVVLSAIADVVIVFVFVINLAVEYGKDCMPRLQLSCRCGLRKLLTAARKFVKSVVLCGEAAR